MESSRLDLSRTTVIGQAVRISLRCLIGGLLVMTALAKSLDLLGFAAVVGTYKILPQGLWLPTAITLTLVEAVLGILLLVGRRTSAAALYSVGLHSAFLVWFSVALLRGLELSNCGCFGVFFVRPLTSAILVEDGVMILASAGLWFIARSPAAPEEQEGAHAVEGR